MDRDAKRMRGERPIVFAQVKAGLGVAEIAAFIERAGGPCWLRRSAGVMRHVLQPIEEQVDRLLFGSGASDHIIVQLVFRHPL